MPASGDRSARSTGALSAILPLTVLGLALAACSDGGSRSEPSPGGSDATSIEPIGEDRARSIVERARERFGFVSSPEERTVKTSERVENVLPAVASGTFEVTHDVSSVGAAFSLIGTTAVQRADVDGTAVYPGGGPGGSDILVRASDRGVEDYVVLNAPPQNDELVYRFTTHNARALRLVGGVLEILDADGAPRVRVAPPYVVDANGQKHAAELDVRGCGVDRDPRAPWGRELPAIGGDRCELSVGYDTSIAHPVLVDPAWQTTAFMAHARTHHTSTPLPDGTILVVGGFDETGAPVAEAEILCLDEALCPLGPTFTVADSLTVPRGAHTETTVGGTLLISGGRSARNAGTSLSSTELYDINSGQFSPGPAMNVARWGHTATLLDTGDVLVAGGEDGSTASTAQLFDGTSFGPIINLSSGHRRGHVAELLNDGRVLIAGGVGVAIARNDAEIYDPTNGTFALVTGTNGTMTGQRAWATATRLDDAQGRIIIVGGTNNVGFYYSTVDVFDPTLNGGEFSQFPPQMQEPRAFHTATKLIGEGKVLITGGNEASSVHDTSEIFVSNSLQFDPLLATMNAPHNFHTATRLASGKVVAIGGGVSGTATAPDSGAVNVLAATQAEIFARVNGEPCDADGECLSGNCYDEPGGVCCNESCTDICSTCFAAKQAAPGPGEGFCGVIDENVPVKPQCTEGVQLVLKCIDGALDITGINSCGAYACEGDACGEACANNADCNEDYYCIAPICTEKNPDGETCTEDFECKNDHCIDGYCCNSECGEQCQACDVEGFLGTCTQVTSGAPHGDRDACDGAGGPCEGECGSTPLKCDYDKTIECGDSTCSDGQRSFGLCSLEVEGECAPAEEGCAPFACNDNGVTCIGACVGPEDCAEGAVCKVDGTCAVIESDECADEDTVLRADGTTEECEPLRCRDGACLSACVSIDDCIEGKVCDANGACIDPPADPAPPESCAVGGAPRSSGGGPLAALALIAIGAVLRAKRKGRRGDRGVVSAHVARVLVALLVMTSVPTAAFAQPAAPSGAPAPAAPPAAPAPGTPPAAAPTGEETEEAPPDPAKRAEAEERFKRGLQLLSEEAWTAALAEFARSRELFPTRNATNNAAVCLRKLKRFDEALDMFESMLRDYPTMPADKKEAAFKEVAELRQLVGTLDIVGAEPGAAIVVDGKNRAEYPIIDPLRVSAGTHTVRLLKRGFTAFESTVEVAGGQTVTIQAKMPALVASGTLRVAEKSGKKMDVVLDGAVVGVTPWEGTIATGDHVVQLIGDADLGTQPSAAPIKKDEVTALTLAAEPLESSVFVKVQPTSANVRIDSVSVGRGIWDGRVRSGSHVIEVVSDGYFPKREEVSLDKGERREITIELKRDEDAEAWNVPSKIVLDLSGGVALTPSFGGDVSSTCGEGCSQGVGLGGVVQLNGAYEFGNGFGLGLSVGAMQASQSVEGRSTTLNPQGLDGLDGSATDDLRLRGILAGAHAAYRYGDKFPLRFRLGAGALIAEARSVRSGTFATRANGNYSAPELESNQTTPFVYIAPEASVGFKIVDQFELGAGVQGLILVAPDAPTWAGDENPSVNAPGDGLSSYTGDETTMGTMVFVVPMVSARASF